MVFQIYYDKLVKKDFILKDITDKVVPEIDKLEIVIYYPKIVDDYEIVFDGVIYLEELSGQFPSLKQLSTKRTGASEYESNYLVRVSLRNKALYDFLFFLYISLLFLWTQRRMILTFSKKLDKQTKVVKLFKKEFFYLFNMPLIYDERRDSWNFQIHVYMKNTTINIDLLGSIFSCFFIYDILNLKRTKKNEILK
uniref:Uncharacterized protein n=1 Tax=Hyaloperonospora arabidopsidis (strain Emoy2) TaxID=559515 RepID=M4C5N1_HYAAE